MTKNGHEHRQMPHFMNYRDTSFVWLHSVSYRGSKPFFTGF